MSSGNKIKTSIIFEIIGRPPENIIKVLKEDVIKNMNKEEGIEVTKETIHEPKLIKDQKDLYTTFAEVEIEADDLNLIFMIVVNMLPANIEIIEPTLIRITNFDLSQTLSELTIKLHRYDEVAKALTMERYALIGKLKEMQKKIKELELKIEDKEEVKKKSKKDKSKK